MLTHENIWRAIDNLAARNDLTPSGLARKAGLDPTAFNKSKRIQDDRQRWPGTEALMKILEVTNSSIGDFISDLEPIKKPSAQTIPLLGYGQAGNGGFFDDGGFPVGEGWDVVELPAAKPGCYAIEVQGDSMLPLYRDGDVVIVEPGAPVRRNDRVVVRTREGEVLVKTLARQTPKAIELLSLNPDHPGRTIASDSVEWIARIVWASQ